MEMTRHGNESILRCISTMELEIVGQTLNWDRCKSDRKLFRPCGWWPRWTSGARVPFGFHGAWLGAEEMRKTRRLGGGCGGEVRVDVGDGDG